MNTHAARPGSALLIGESLVDVVRHSDGTVSEHAGGSPLNVAIGLARLGRDVTLVTHFADDRYGQMVAEHLQRDGVRVVRDASAEQTSVARASVRDDGRTDYDFSFHFHIPTPDLPADCALVHTGSIGAFLDPGSSTALAFLESVHGQVLTTYDPNIRPTLMGEARSARDKVECFVRVADVVKVSDEDIEWLTGGADPLQIAREWVGMGPALVVLTRGGEGAVAITASGSQLEVSPPSVQVVDTVGAGDSFMGALCDGLWELGCVGAQAREHLESLSDECLRAVLERCAQVAAITVSRAGANPPGRDEIGRLA